MEKTKYSKESDHENVPVPQVQNKEGGSGGSQDISWQNQDIIERIFAEGLKEKSLQVYGIPSSRIKKILPINLPEIGVSGLLIDSLFQMEDGSYALIAYESSLQEQ